MTPKKIFISYSKKEEEMKNEFVEFLQPLVISGRITIWTDQEILVSELWDKAIETALIDADIVIFLISPSFLANTYINTKEIKKAFELRKKGKIIVAILLRHSAVDQHIIPGTKFRFTDFQCLPPGLIPIAEWKSHDEAWLKVVNAIKHLFA